MTSRTHTVCTWSTARAIRTWNLSRSTMKAGSAWDAESRHAGEERLIYFAERQWIRVMNRKCYHKPDRII